MLSLKGKIEAIKNDVLRKQKIKKMFDAEFTRILKEVFGNFKDYPEYLSSFYIKSNNLVIETKNKVFASELFLKKEEIINKLRNFRTINQIIIK